MKSSLVQEQVFSYPASAVVIKKTTDDYITFRCVLQNINADNIIVEVWTNILGRYHGYELTKEHAEHAAIEYTEHAAIEHTAKEHTDGATNDIFFSRTFALKNTGFFKSTFRWRNKKDEYWNWQSSADDKDYAEIHVDPSYINKSIVYNAFIRFFGHQEDNQDGKSDKHLKLHQLGTFDDLKVKLDEIKAMGVDILYLNPIHPIGELFRNYNPHDQYPKYMQPGCPYSVRDYKAIDPEIGLDKDHSQGPHSTLSDPMIEFKDLVREAHKRNIKVFMDLVFNHTSHDFVLQRLHPEWFLYKDDIKSLESPYIYPDEVKSGKPWGDPKHTMCPYDHGYWWEDAAQLNWQYMLPDVNDNADIDGKNNIKSDANSDIKNKPPKNPTIDEMYAYFKSIPQYWIKHIGIDGFRCDVAYRVPPQFWKQCIHESRELAKQLKKENPKESSLTGDVVFIAESYVDDIDVLFKAGFSSVYGDFSNKLYSVQTLKGYLDYMYNISGKYFPENSKFFIFPECHDFHRNTKKLLGQVSNDKILSERANKSRWVLTATLPGIPMIFNGYEKMEWKPVNLFSYSSIDWESDKDLKKYITKVNKIRLAHHALQVGDYEYVKTDEDLNEHAKLFSFIRNFRKGDANGSNDLFLVCVNMDLHKKVDMVKILLPDDLLDFKRHYLLHDLLNGKRYVREGSELSIVLEPGESHIFKVTQDA